MTGHPLPLCPGEVAEYLPILPLMTARFACEAIRALICLAVLWGAPLALWAMTSKGV